MSFFDPQNPGIGIHSLTSAEIVLIQDLASLGDPGGDRILFWDDSAGTYEWLQIGTNLSITDTTLNASGGGGGDLSDGDYGDITVSGTATVFTIDNDVVTYAKMQNVSATDRVLGRSTAGAGDVEEITFTSFARQLADDTSFSAMRTTLGLAIGSDVLAYDAGVQQIADLADPGADRILFWDDSAGVYTFLAVGSGLSITDTTISATGGGGATLSEDVAQTAHGLAVGDVLKSSATDNEYAKAQADAAANAEVVGIVTAVTDANNFTYTYGGIVDVAAAVPAGTAGTVLFLSASVAGALTATETSTTGQVSKPLAIILEDGNKMLWLNMRGMELADGSTPYTDELAQDAIGGILTDSSTIDFTYNDGTPSITAIVIDDSITYSKIQNVSATSRILGRITASAGDIEELTAANVFTILGITSTASELNILDGATLTVTELNYVDGVTSAIQTQLDGKQAQDAFLDDIAALTDPGGDRLLFWDDSAGEVTWLTLGTGLTITDTTIAAAGGGSIDGSGTTNEIAYWVDSDTLGALAVATYPSLTELAHVKGVTSAIQTQFTAKAPLASPTFTGTVSVPATNFTVGSSLPFSDSSGTLTLQNIDALDATTEATIEAAIDTLANLTSIQSLTVTLADAGADALLGWDDSAGAYENLTQAEVLAVIGDSSVTAKGVVELATTAETETGTDATRAVTPDGLHDMTTLAGAAWFLDEDNMASDSATKTASQQSIKAYVDAEIAGVSAGSGISWTEVTGTSQAAAVNNGYIANNAALVTVTLPTTAAVGSIVRVAGKGAGGWLIAQNASELIRFGSSTTTTGTGGSLASVNRYDAAELVCIAADTEWAVISSIGNITIV